jgi:hypothetical protein
VLGRWWVNKYKLPPNHDLFQSRPLAEWQLEMFEDTLARREAIRAELKAIDQAKASKGAYQRRTQLFEQLNAINEYVGDPIEYEDALLDKWEAELEAGIEPNLNER